MKYKLRNYDQLSVIVLHVVTALGAIVTAEDRKPAYE